MTWISRTGLQEGGKVARGGEGFADAGLTVGIRSFVYSDCGRWNYPCLLHITRLRGFGYGV